MRVLLLLVGLSGGIWIDVPFVRQDKDGCGSAAIWMILQYWGADNVPPVDEMQHELYSPRAGGIYAADMERYFQKRRFRTFVFNAEWADLEQHLAQRRPLIVCLGSNSRGVPLHYVVVAGVDSDRQIVWLNDPAARKLTPMGRSEFEKAWMDNWTLLALPEQGEPLTTSSSPTVVPSASYGPEMDLATVAFREQRYADARSHVRELLRSRPTDAFANDLMATLYFLDENLEASLKYWNRAGKPAVRDILVEPQLRLDPVLLERGFAFSRATTLRGPEYRETESKFEATGVFARYQLTLEPVGDNRFDVVLRAREKSRIGLSWFRGLPFKTIHPEVFNLAGRAINIRSLLRWDSDRRRAWVSVSAPLIRNPTWKYSIAFDGRNERWESPSAAGAFRKSEIRAELHSIINDRWNWSSGAAVSKRGAYGIKYVGAVEHSLIRVPEQRFSTDARTSFEVGRTFETTSSRFTKVEVELNARWFPQTKGDNYEVRSIVRAGRAGGSVPFDELFVVGLDRDYGLWLRAHDAVRHESYAVSNWDFQKRLYQGTFLGIYAGPFLDAGVVSRRFGALFDAGGQFRLAVLGGVNIDLSFGRDLRSGRNKFFATTSH